MAWQKEKEGKLSRYSEDEFTSLKQSHSPQLPEMLQDLSVLHPAEGRKEGEKGKGRRKRKEGSLSEQLFGWLACDEALLWAITGGTCCQADPLCCALEPWPEEGVALAQETWGHAKALCTCMSQCEAPSEGSGKNALIKLVNAIRQELSSNPLKY